ncbi:hydroxylamine reductase [Gordonibacter sp. 28C]|uniref:hydroxylamine reductase n=1 Tax=Gordonibacter sp. 28C TaxID=2078569 RepID=UPI000DF76C65|nr:hydroxylamine reductase [Gordonibacter sp. 28C]RDB64518.1 hydroxylamine reductase [Gordonibacter sp. 28C]
MSETNTMFCFQCEQTAGYSGCTGAAGACGKQAGTARLQDEVTGALVGLALTVRAAGASGDARRAADDLVMEGLFATLTNVDFDDAELRGLVARVHAERDAIAMAARVEAAPDYDLAALWNAPEDVRSLKSLVLFGLRGLAAYAYHAAALGYRDDAVSSFLHEGLAALADAEAGADVLLPLSLKVGEVNLRCMELLDQANTETFGTPEPATVARAIEAGPFIVVSGHDLHDLKLLLDQTEGRGVNVYTHGELLPAHAYPELRRCAHLKGNLGTAWQNQRAEFADLPAPILFTTNCLMPPAASYADRVFTTGPVAYPGIVHIGAGVDGGKDFEPLIQRALELGGYDAPAGQDGTFVTGFGHGTVLGAADTVVDAVKQGAISRFFLVGGCDGARPGRSYFRDFVQQAPDDSIILTLACGKFRFNDLDLGTIGGLPRIMDMGQCNDAYGAIRVAVALAEAFECGVNDLPLTLVLSWYEQKAVSILLTLLHLGIRGIYLGPTLPAFVSPGVLDVLVREFDVRPISTPEEDLATILA